VVLVEPDAADAAAAGPLVTADVPHLSVVVREGTVVVGPLVLPGRSACLCCLDLHRRDRDPAWPRILTQLLRARGQGGLPAAEETASTQLGASLAALQVLAALDDNGPDHRPAAVSATLEVELPDGLLGRREWQVHPACGCLRLPR
jgi:bacteriocin biosynthesis cyclodehydratase domain-containing protein